MALSDSYYNLHQHLEIYLPNPKPYRAAGFCWIANYPALCDGRVWIKEQAMYLDRLRGAEKRRAKMRQLLIPNAT